MKKLSDMVEFQRRHQAKLAEANKAKVVVRQGVTICLLGIVAVVLVMLYQQYRERHPVEATTQQELLRMQ